MKETAKLLSVFTLSLISTFLGLQALSFVNVSATSQDNCDQVFTYEKSNDFSDSRVNINFESNDNQIDVSAQSGYQITEVALDVKNDGYSGFFVYATSAVNNLNPNPGNDIEEARVKVKKVCASPTPTPTPSPSLSASPSPSPTPTPTPTSSPSPSPSPSPNNTQNGSSPAPSPSPSPSVDPSSSPSVDSSPTATASASPLTGGTDNNSSSTSSNSNNEVKSSFATNAPEPAKVTSLANTGTFVQSLMNSAFVSGILTFAFGLKRYVQSKKT